MRRRLTVLVVILLSAAGCGRRPPGPPVSKTEEISAKPDAAPPESPAPRFGPHDWPQWRGPLADGVASGPAVPTRWSHSENVLWKTKIAGRGHSSPIVVGDRIVLATADEAAQTQSVVCFDRDDGRQLWQTELHRGRLETAIHNENSQATSTVASDGERLFALFLNDRKIWATALDFEGRELWRTEVGSFASKFGYSASPTLYRSLLLLAADHGQGGYLAAVDRVTGALVWRKARPEKSSYASPRVVTLGGKDQLVICGCGWVAAYDPLTGENLWSTPGTAESGVGTPVVAMDRVFASGGYPEQDTVALNPDGSVAWRKNVKAYCTSLLAHDGHVYLVSDDGIASCFDAARGDEKWKKRLGGRFRASPVLSGDNLFITDMVGKTTVFRADPAKFTAVAENHLGSEGWASPAISDGRLFLRVVDASQGSRQEWLYCIGFP